MDKLKSNWQIVVGIIITLLVAGGIFYFGRNIFVKPTSKITPISSPSATPAPVDVEKETSSWRTYQNDQLNFSIKFPADIVVSENIRTKQISFPFSKKCSLDICEGVYINGPQASPSAVPKIADFDHQTNQIKKDNKIYTFDLYTTKEKADTNIKNFNLMIKTFKFLK